MLRGFEHLRLTKRGWLCAAAGLLVALAFLEMDRAFSFATIIGARPLLMAVGLALVTALGVAAASSARESRKPTLATAVPVLLRLLAWWGGVSLALAIVSFASWKEWGIACLFVAIAATIKAITVFTYVKRDYQFRIWLPFAAFIGIFLFIQAIMLFLGRTDIPPPVTAAIHNYNVDPTAPDPATRPAPDLSSGYTLAFKGDVDLGGLPVTFYSFTPKGGGARVDLYLAKISFPTPLGSTETTDPGGWWVKQDNVFLRGGSTPTHFLIVSSSQLIEDPFAHAYSLTGSPP